MERFTSRPFFSIPMLLIGALVIYVGLLASDRLARGLLSLLF